MVTITLLPALEKVVAERAERQGTTPELLAIDKLNTYFLPAVPTAPAVEGETMADFLAEFIGSINSSEYVPGGANMSEKTGKDFAEGMMKKHREGKL